MLSGWFKNVINKMILQILYNMYKQVSVLNNLW